jgi:hypothetical protein
MKPEDYRDPKVLKAAVYRFYLFLGLVVGALAIAVLLAKGSGVL